jgi:hypothetical protein
MGLFDLFRRKKRDDTWSGGFYEICFRIPESMTAPEALSALWSHTDLEGCYADRSREPDQQDKRFPTDSDYEGHWYGVATLPNRKQCAAGSFWGEYGDAGVWLTFYIPLASLGSACSIGAYPLKVLATPDPHDWMFEVNSWLKKIAEDIFPLLQFSLALIGFEVEYDGQTLERLRKGIPTERWDGILLREGSQLNWYPPTEYDPPLVVGK